MIQKLSEKWVSGQPTEKLDERIDGLPWWLVEKLAKFVIESRPVAPYPGWQFGTETKSSNPKVRLRLALWRHFHRKQLQRPINGRWYGIKFNAFLGNDLSRSLFVEGCIEPNEFALLHSVLADDMVFVDVGANEGLYTVFAGARVGPRGRVLAIEPSEREVRRLDANIRLNRLNNVIVKRLALHASEGEAELLVAEYGHEGHNTLGRFAHEGVAESHRETVPLRTLDLVVGEEQLDRLDVIKVDAEGAEFAALQGARRTLARWRPLLMIEVSDETLQAQGSSSEELIEWLHNEGYGIYEFDDRTGRIAQSSREMFSGENVVAVHPGRSWPALDGDLGSEMPKQTRSANEKDSVMASGFSPARALLNQKDRVLKTLPRFEALTDAVGRPSDLAHYQWAQLLAAVLEFAPDRIVELGRGSGNSTCVFTEAASQLGSCTVVSICLTTTWDEEIAPRIRSVVSEDWFDRLDTRVGDILKTDPADLVGEAQRVLVFWDAHGFDLAEFVLGALMPTIAGRNHLVIMHDISDPRYIQDSYDYEGTRLWRRNMDGTSYLQIGNVWSTVEQAVSVLDFTTRNQIELGSADHSLHSEIDRDTADEFAREFGPWFSRQGHWAFFSTNGRESSRPLTFPRFDLDAILQEKNQSVIETPVASASPTSRAARRFAGAIRALIRRPR